MNAFREPMGILGTAASLVVLYGFADWVYQRRVSWRDVKGRLTLADRLTSAFLKLVICEVPVLATWTVLSNSDVRVTFIGVCLLGCVRVLAAILGDSQHVEGANLGWVALGLFLVLACLSMYRFVHLSPLNSRAAARQGHIVRSRRSEFDSS